MAYLGDKTATVQEMLDFQSNVSKLDLSKNNAEVAGIPGLEKKVDWNGVAEQQKAFKNYYMENLALTKYGFLDKHYFRNVNNDPKKAINLQPESRNYFHSPGKKYLSDDGHHESVLLPGGDQMSGRRRATYNYGNQKGVLGNMDHLVRDIVPHILLGP